MVQFLPVTRESYAGRAREPIPPPVRALLDRTYQTNTMARVPMPEDEASEFLRVCRLYAKHRGLTIQAAILDGDQVDVRMKRKRPYRRRQEDQ